MNNVKIVVRNPDSKKRHILEAARRLLIKRGFQNIVLDDIAREAGVAKGTLFLYYKSKEDLFAAALADLVDGLGLELEVLAKTGLKGKEMLASTARVILNHFDHSRDFMAQFIGGRLPGCGARAGGKMMEKIRTNHARVRVLIALASKDEARSIADLDFAAAAFIGLCRSATMRKIVHGHDRPLEQEAERVVAFFLEGSGVSL
ncbi:MAG TPA: hypothetical protein DCZ01_07815 [Elusimicrobia bacterium]|nr:MAG: hypothetical protein A2X37_01210 [Elusimicrobia bacterium GWA2_66_18]OGR75973.1 MAG: hypothetical protein A2X40_08495 [Elusimicrobia bacterium GWC2_65_9]HAZ08411.1 hypothetical protein [Elusimicrobiota bacterium]